jgi:predicted DCC family thiol-disulfide oxidoreductase YuxK
VAMGFHLGIAITMGLVSFSIVMAGADLSLLDDGEYAALRQRVLSFTAPLRRVVRRLRSPAFLFIDGDCIVCQRFGARVSQLCRAVDVQSFRGSTHYQEYGIAIDRLEREMHLVVPEADRYVARGFAALCALAWRTPLAWPLLPALYAAGYAGAGPAAYRLFASRRHRFFPKDCGDRCSADR